MKLNDLLNVMTNVLTMVKDDYGRLCIVGDKEQGPIDPDWLKMQKKPIDPNGELHTCYPLTGGAVTVDLNTATPQPAPTQEQIKQVLGYNPYPFNPAASAVMKLLSS
jgi:hypothetical protein